MARDVGVSSGPDTDLVRDFRPEEYWVVRPDGQTARLVLSDLCSPNMFFAGFVPAEVPLPLAGDFLWEAIR